MPNFLVRFIFRGSWAFNLTSIYGTKSISSFEMHEQIKLFKVKHSMIDHCYRWWYAALRLYRVRILARSNVKDIISFQQAKYLVTLWCWHPFSPLGTCRPSRTCHWWPWSQASRWGDRPGSFVSGSPSGKTKDYPRFPVPCAPGSAARLKKGQSSETGRLSDLRLIL